MFGLFKRKPREIIAPIDGMLVPLEQVEDEVFSAKLAGDGLAIIPVGDTFVAPIAGVITKIFSTNHAYSIKGKQDLEVLVHIGLDTVGLKGKGFERLANEGDTVEAGDAIIKVNLAYLAEHAKDIITPILISDESKVKHIDKRENVVKQGDHIMRVH